MEGFGRCKDDSICGFEGMESLRGKKKRIGRNARVAQWWSIALPRRGSRVRIPSRAFLIDAEVFVCESFRSFLFHRKDPAILMNKSKVGEGFLRKGQLCIFFVTLAHTDEKTCGCYPGGGAAGKVR